MNSGRIGLILLAAALGSGCAGQSASHLPHPLALPGAAIGTAIENGIYGARRRQVSDWVQTHHAKLIAQIRAGGGGHLQHAMDLARVPQQDRQALIHRLTSDLALYQSDPEALIVALMVHGGS